MINTIEEFLIEHPKADIVNYDTQESLGYGLTFRASTGSVEYFRKDRLGKEIEYPYIQPYLNLSPNSKFELFIIHNSKMYQLEQSNKENTYKIKRELTNVSPLIGKDIVFDEFKRRKDPRIQGDQPIYIIEE